MREISRMGDYYGNAALTLAMLPDINMGVETCLTSYNDTTVAADWISMACKLAQQIIDSEWLSRVWAFQESILSPNLLVLGSNGFMSRTDVRIALFVRDTCSWGQKKNEIVSSMEINASQPERGLSVTTFPNNLTSDYFLGTIREGFHFDTASGLGYSKGKFYSLDACWQAAGPRRCTDTRDIVNGFLGLLEKTVTPITAHAWRDMMWYTLHQGILSARVMNGITSTLQGECWMPKSAGDVVPICGGGLRRTNRRRDDDDAELGERGTQR
jgi:hypothetical protein